MFSRTFASAVLVLGLICLTGCSSAPRFAHIGVRVTEIKPAAGNELVLSLKFISSNTLPLIAAQADYKLTLNGQRIGEIHSTDPVGIPPLGSTTQDVRVPAALAESIRRLATANAGPTAYDLASTLFIVWGDDDTAAYKTSSEGSLTLKPQPTP
ncbi:MAG: LEA type 2 family protein [Verrucomicrobia bacterium]|nr:LEA type 2 family protein [Verrucomicrobiota bacterium]